MARAENWTAKWTETFFAPPSDPKDYSGFLSFATTRKGAAAVYLAPPPSDSATPPAATNHSDHSSGEAEHRKTLRCVHFDSAGRPTGDEELDSDTCSCCQTTLTNTPDGLVVAYRDHLPGEVRDISFMRQNGGRWTTPGPVHRDGWVINGCPTDGPSLASHANLVGVAWLTRAAATARVQLAVSTHSKAAFAAPLRLDEGNPMGRPCAVMLGNDFLVSWLEKTNSGAEIRLRRITPSGNLKASVAVAKVPASRTTGFPRLAVAGDRILVAWRDGQVRFASLDAASVA